MTVQSAPNVDDDEPMDTSDKPENKEDDNPLSLTHQIIDEILSKDKLTSFDYDALADIARNSPLAIESKFHEVFKKVLLEEKPSQDDKDSYEKLMTDILEACVRLRRDKKLVSWILMALSQTLKETDVIARIDQSTIYILPAEFINQFSQSISKLTNSQVISVLASLIYHLDSCLMSSENEKSKECFSFTPNTLTIFTDVVKQISVAFLEGVDVFDSTWPLPGKQKFVSGLVNLGKCLLKLVKTLKRKIKEKNYEVVGMNLWKITESWQTIVGFIRHYAPDAVSEENWSDILNCTKITDDIFRKVETNEITNECLAFLKLKESKAKYVSNLYNDITDESPEETLCNLEQCWPIIIHRYPHVVNNFSNDEISAFSQFVVENFDTISEKVTFIGLHNNRSLVTALVFQTFTKMDVLLNQSTSTTKKLTEKIGKVKWWECEKYSKILKSHKKVLTTPEWTSIDDNNILNHLQKFLKILLTLPLMYCSTELKTIIVLTTLTIKKETFGDSEAEKLCTEILSDVTESYSEDVLQYISPNLLILELSNSQHILSRFLESSLTNTANYEPLRECIKSHFKNDQNISTMVVECIDRVKPKLKTPEDKKLLVKFEKKLFKKILADENDDSLNSSRLKSLAVALKAAVALKKVDETLIQKIRTTLEALIGKTNEKGDLKFTKESYQLIKVVLQYRSSASVDSTMIRNIWSLMLEKSCNDVLPLLIGATSMKLLNQALNLLTKQTAKSLEKVDEISFENCVKIWNCVAKADMGVGREKIRQGSFQRLMQSIKITESLITSSIKIETLKFFTSIISSKKMIIPDRTIDLILLVANSFMNDVTATLPLSHETLDVISAFLKFRPGVATDNLPIVTKLYLKTIQCTVEDARKSSEQQQLHCLITLEIQKLASAFVKLKKDIAKISPYIVADLIGICYGGGVVPNYVKEPLDDTVRQFLSICDQHGISLLFRALPPSMQEIFKILYDTYVKFYKFTGKV